MPPVRRAQAASGKESALTNNIMVGKLNDMSRNKCLESALSKFQGGDKDHSNSINLEEFLKLAKNIPVLKGRGRSTLVETFEKIDVDASGALNISEFHSFYADLKMLTKTSNLIPYPDNDLDDLKGFRYYRKYIWMTFDTYDTRIGKVCGPIIIFLIFLSVVSYCLETIPKLSDKVCWSYIDAVISVVFTFEFVLRMCTAWDIWEFGTSILNIIDLCSFLPFYIELVLILCNDKSGARFDWLRVLRICRLMKILRVSTYINSCLVIFSETVILAKDSLIMLANVTLMCTLVLSALVYSAEEDTEPKTFRSVFETMYWCAVTQTTLGYGDINVVTPLGRLLACVTAIIGIINLAFMVNLVGSCFDEAYTRFLSREEQDFKKRLEDEWGDNADEVKGKRRLLSDIQEASDEGADEFARYSLATCVAELNLLLIQIQEGSRFLNDSSCESRLQAIMAKTRDSIEAKLKLRPRVEP